MGTSMGYGPVIPGPASTFGVMVNNKLAVTGLTSLYAAERWVANFINYGADVKEAKIVMFGWDRAPERWLGFNLSWPGQKAPIQNMLAIAREPRGRLGYWV